MSIDSNVTRDYPKCADSVRRKIDGRIKELTRSRKIETRPHMIYALEATIGAYKQAVAWLNVEFPPYTENQMQGE